MEPLEGRALLANLLANGDFELGNVGFTSQYPVENATGGYIIGRNPAADRTRSFLSFGDHTTGAGLMNQVDGATIPDQIVWQETVAVSPGTDHTFSGWATSMGSVDPSPARLRFLVNGVPIGTDYPVPAQGGNWSQFSAAWNSGAADVATIQIIDLNTEGGGNDFALDDLSLEAIPWAPPHLVVTTQPPDNVRVGVGFGLTVAVENQFGNVDAYFDGTVAVTLASNPGGAVLDGILTTTVHGGGATFSGLTLDRVGTGYTLSIAGDGLAAAATVAFDVAPAPTGPSAYTVDVADASGTGSGDAGDLAYIVARADADANPFGSVIRFDPAVFSTPRTITLTSPLILSQTAGPIAIEGPGAGLLTISGGDAVRAFRVDVGVHASISGLTLTDGRDYEGGAINNAGNLTLDRCYISGNTAASPGAGYDPYCECYYGGTPGYGGALFNSGTMWIGRTTISDNEAEGTYINRYTFGGGRGGGVFNSGELTLVNSTVCGNRAPFFESSGGGVFNSGVLWVANSTFADNTAHYGGGISTTADPGAWAGSIGSIYSNPTYPYAPEDVGNVRVADGGVFRSRGHNLFSDDPALPLDPTDLVGFDPRLGPLQDNGGPTPTMALLPGSPALDAGVAVDGVEADQRGVPRPRGAAPDVGAFESRALAPAFAALASPAIVYGAAATVSGRIAAASGAIPPGEVAVTLGGVTLAAAIDPATGAFAATFPAAGLHVAPSPYAVSYRYAGSGDILAADAAGSLAVAPAPLVVVADDRAVPFGADVPPLTATYVGLADGDGPAGLARPAALTTAAVAYSLPGRYAIVVSGAESADYAISYVDGVLTVAEPAGRRARGGLALVTSLYRDVLGRAPEPAGLRAWMGRLEAGGRPGSVARGVWASREHRLLVRGPGGPGVGPGVAWSRAMRAWRLAAR